MEKGKRSRRWLVPLSCMVILLATAGFVTSTENDVYLKIDRGITLFGRVYKEITANYVDEVDPEKFMEAGIEGMLGTLDPYTVYISKDEGDEVDLMTNGNYGGIGVTIGSRDGIMRVMTVMDGYSAQRQGILPGDVLLEVDGMSVNNKKTEDVRNLTRGEPGTQVKVKVQREGASHPLEFVLTREQIQLHNVTYADFASPGIGYIRLERFSRRAGEEVRQAIQELKVKGNLDALILDLRGNPGGLLDAAVDVAGKFLPKGSTVVSTRGRNPESEKKFVSNEEPLLPSIPVAVLADHGSASASEIVAGALQDLDRAVVVGTTTYGKGLVQTILPLSYGAQLKVTTARYYTPSGRCIQEVDYQHKDKNGIFAVTPDSLRKEFQTAHGRPVYERGGIHPDSLVSDIDEGPMVRELSRKALFFSFANRYVSMHHDEQYAGVTDKILQEFKKYLETEKFDFTEDGEAKIKDLRKIAVSSHYSPDVLTDIGEVESLLVKEKQRAFERYQEYISGELSEELAARYGGEKGRIAASLHEDPQLDAAMAIVKNARLYGKLLKE